MTRRSDLAPRIAFQGEPGAYGEEAVIGYFGAGRVEAAPVPTFAAVCAAVESGTAAGGVLPLENSAAGSVGDALDALVRGRLRVVGELLLPVRHHLLALPGTELADVERVASHWQALAQCERFLSSRRWTLVAAADTAGAARELSQAGDRRLAVIASRAAAARYGLAVLAGDIQDDPGNTTRFAVIARSTHAARAQLPSPALALPSAPRSTLLVFETAHVAGALHAALGAFAEAGVNLSRIESRPAGGTRWRYRFLVQVEGSARREPLRSALRSLRQRSRSVRVLGSFPSAQAAPEQTPNGQARSGSRPGRGGTSRRR